MLFFPSLRKGEKEHKKRTFRGKGAIIKNDFSFTNLKKNKINYE
jgi:hypothetical protein